MRRLVWVRFVVPTAIAGLGALATSSVVFAYPGTVASAKLVNGCASSTPGQHSPFQFQFFDQSGHGISNLAVTFTESGASGSTVAPPAGTTDSGGFVSTTFTASTTATGFATVTAASGSVSASGTCQVDSAGGVLGVSTGGLPNTSTAPPGTNPAAYVGLSLALLILIGGAITLRQARRAA